jgi:hypothetical protein
LWIETETDNATYGTSIVLFAHKTVGGSADDATVTITSKAGTIPSWIRLLANDILLIGNVEIDGYDDITGDLVVNGTIKDGSGIAYLKSTEKAADSDKVDGFHASATPTANTVPVAGANKKLNAGWLPEQLINLPIGGFVPQNSATVVAFNSSSVINMPDSGTPAIDFTLPILYAGKSLKLNIMFSSSSTGVVKFGYEIRKLVTTGGHPSPATLSTSFTGDVTTAGAGVNIVSTALNTSGYALGTHIVVRLYRDTTDANTGDVTIWGTYLEAV